MADDDGGPGGVLALHLGTVGIGWCYGASDLGLWRLPKTADHGILAAALIDKLADFNKLLHPRVIAVTGPPNEVEASGSPDVAVLHIGLLMVVRLFAGRRKIVVEVPNIYDIRAAVLGRAEFPKSGLRSAVLSFAKRRGLNTIEVDTAHALLTWEWRCKQEARA